MATRVLLVEDSSSTRSFVAGVLEEVGITDVTHAASGFAALQALPRGRFDLVITDVNVPDVSGLELIRFVRASAVLQHLPLLVISTEGRDRDRERCLALGANRFLSKPFTPAELIEAVRGVLLAPEPPR